MSVDRINKACKYYPCHEKLSDCTFCNCPFYACGNKRRGKYIEIKDEINPDIKKLIWDCSKCTWIHKKSTVDKIFKEIRENFLYYNISKK